MRGKRYRRILAIREARQPVLGTAIERIPIAGMALATILLVRAETGSFAIAGAVEAGFGIATAVSFPLQGRLVDRLGETRVLSGALALHPLALGGVVIAAESGAGAPSPRAVRGAGRAAHPPPR